MAFTKKSVAISPKKTGSKAPKIEGKSINISKPKRAHHKRKIDSF